MNNFLHPTKLMEIFMKTFSASKAAAAIMAAVSAFFLISNITTEAADYADDNVPVGFYINAGVLGDMAISGYDSALIKRDPRLGYQVEVGGAFFAVPVSFSQGQNVEIYGIKPRLQYLFPFTEYLLSAGPGLGATYNYWKSDIGLSGTDFEVTVHELGIQPSFQIMVRPWRNLNLLITPVAIDFNFWRQVHADTGVRGIGNFSASNKDTGVVYSAGASLGVSF